MSAERGEASAPPESYTGPRIAAVLVIAVGVSAIVGGLQVREAGGFSVVGPRQFPIAVGAGLVVLGALFLAGTALRPDRDLGRRAAEEERATHWPTTGAAIGLLLGYAFAFISMGYVVATVPFFVAQARVLGSRKPVRDIVVGLGLSIVVYVGFTRFLGVPLPTGPVESLLAG